MAKIVIFGTGDIAELAYYYFTTDTEHKVAVFAVDNEYLKSEKFCGQPVVPFEDIENQYKPGMYKMFIALSYTKVNKLRTEKYIQAREKGYDLVSYISSRATVFDNVKIGNNCFILEDNTIQPFVEIGNNTTLWSGNHIGHHALIGDHCFITSHAVVSGGVVIEPFCFIGVNATLRDHIRIASGTVIGAGALILADTQPNSIYKGVPTQTLDITSDRLFNL